MIVFHLFRDTKDRDRDEFPLFASAHHVIGAVLLSVFLALVWCGVRAHAARVKDRVLAILLCQLIHRGVEPLQSMHVDCWFKEIELCAVARFHVRQPYSSGAVLGVVFEQLREELLHNGIDIFWESRRASECGFQAVISEVLRFERDGNAACGQLVPTEFDKRVFNVFAQLCKDVLGVG